jgi:RND superfamily putative drug exporter
VAGEAGLESFVTGPGGFLADFVEAFAGIDGLLLVVAVIVVLVILLVVYRSPLLPLIVLLSALLALGTASALIYVLADAGTITLNGQSQGILFILVVGAATDYALLLVSRFREELREHNSRFAAMRVAWRQVFAPILASGTTVILGVLCLLFSDLNSNQGLGPVAAIGIACSLLVALTFLPAALALLGRAAFWPFRPRYGSPHGEESGLWGRVARLVGRRPRAVWIGTAVVLAALAAFAPRLDSSGTEQSDLFLTEVESVTGQQVLAEHFPAGSGSPAAIIGPAEALDALTAATRGVQGVSSVAPVGAERPGGDQQPRVVDGLVQLDATLADAADSRAAERTVQSLRRELDAVSPAALVGGPTAIQLDTREAAERDRTVILPIVLLVVLVVLVLLLRAVVAPLLLIATVVLSFAATLGVAALAFEYLFGFPGSDPSVPLFAFVFLVALGIDYNIFLMTRVREESWRRGTRPGILRGLAVTGGVITSAGLVLAATFSALAVLPILFLAQIAFLVGFGVLLDALVVRSLLVPALSYDIGRRIWWPSRLARAPGATPKHAANQPAAEPAKVARG